VVYFHLRGYLYFSRNRLRGKAPQREANTHTVNAKAPPTAQPKAPKGNSTESFHIRIVLH